MAKPLTEKQQLTLQYVRDHIAVNGYPPTIAEVADHFGIYGQAAWLRLDAIRRKGHIEVSPRTARGIRVLHQVAGGGAL